MQRFPDFADREERAGSCLFDLQRLLPFALNESDESVQHRQRRLCGLAFGCLQGLDDSSGFFGIGHTRRPAGGPLSRAYPSPSSAASTRGGDIGKL